MQVTDPGRRREYDGKTIAEVQELFPLVPNIAEKLQGIAKRAVAQEVRASIATASRNTSRSS